MPIPRTHVGVYAIIKNAGQIALILKSRGPYTGLLDLPGGKIEYGETAEECLRREVQEELHATVTKSQLLTVLQNSITYQEGTETIQFQHIGIIFAAEIANNSLENVQEHDVQSSGWHNLSDLTSDQLTFLAQFGIKMPSG